MATTVLPRAAAHMAPRLPASGVAPQTVAVANPQTTPTTGRHAPRRQARR